MDKNNEIKNKIYLTVLETTIEVYKVIENYTERKIKFFAYGMLVALVNENDGKLSNKDKEEILYRVEQAINMAMSAKVSKESKEKIARLMQ